VGISDTINAETSSNDAMVILALLLSLKRLFFLLPLTAIIHTPYF
jgi:hypothetical protein